MESPHTSSLPKSMGVICIFPLAALAGMAGAIVVTVMRNARRREKAERTALTIEMCFSENICLFMVTPVCPEDSRDGFSVTFDQYQNKDSIKLQIC